MVGKRNNDHARGMITIMELVKSVIVPGHDAENVLVFKIMIKPVNNRSSTNGCSLRDTSYAVRRRSLSAGREQKGGDRRDGYFTKSSLLLTHGDFIGDILYSIFGLFLYFHLTFHSFHDAAHGTILLNTMALALEEQLQMDDIEALSFISEYPEFFRNCILPRVMVAIENS